jgi:hypothetical protein
MLGSRNLSSVPLRQSPTLHDRVLAGLAEAIPGSRADFSLGSSEADLLVHQGRRVAGFEVKTGDPDLPLPSSTSAQMLLLKEQVQQQLLEEDPDVEEVLPVVVTNYKVTPADRKELEEQGITLVFIDPAVARNYDFAKFSRQVANLAGLQSEPIQSNR